MTPAYEAQEQLAAVVTGMTKGLGAGDWLSRMQPKESLAWVDSLSIVGLATPFYWEPKCVNIVKDMAKKFIDEAGVVVTSRYLLSTDYAFHYFQEPLFMIDDLPVKAVSWGWALNAKLDTYGLHLAAWVKVDGLPHLVPSLWLTRQDGRSYFDKGAVAFGHELINAEEEDTLANFCLVASTFLRQKLFNVSTPTLPRHARKRLDRLKVKLPEVNLVQMRAKQYDRKEPTGEGRDWQWRWKVKSHIRQQWYPSIGARLPIIIEEFEKGPPDKPLKPRTGTIVVVNR